jgi:three-Cys-motif partner protein
MTDVDHEFGGPWTELKLDAVKYYLDFYTAALHRKPTPERPFQLWYVDAFAGSGDRTAAVPIGGVHEGTPLELQKVRLAGSAARALDVRPAFDRLVFIERRPEFCEALGQLAQAHPDRTIDVHCADSNDLLPQLLDAPPWRGRSERPARGVVFLDHYHIVEWATLQAIARTGALDVWYLFPIAAVLRQAARDFDMIDASKAAYLDRAFGSPAWRTELYKPPDQSPLFAGHEQKPQRGDRRAVELYVQQRLKTIFPFVSEPLQLLTPQGAQLFSLFFATANTSPAAQQLAAKCLRHLMRRYGPLGASRRRSGP